ncbi:MAG: Trk system potassium transporter TrkA [SAR324 cluster bacterium]|nr:Trk system potassium transporter TrkA [SAR324 cluster bacterium]
MNVILCGCGAVGMYLLSELTKINAQILVIESDPAVGEEVRDNFDVMVINESALSCHAYEMASTIANDLFIAVLGNDAENLVACMMAKKYGIKRTIARIGSNKFFKTQEGSYDNFLGVDMVISPESLTAQEINRLIRSYGALSVYQFAGGKVEAARMKLSAGSSWIGYAIQDIKLPKDIMIGAVIEKGAFQMARGGTMIRQDSELMLIGLSESIHKHVMEHGHLVKEHRDKIFFGGLSPSSRMTLGLMENLHSKIQIIEQSRSVCESLAEEFPQISVIQGDSTNSRKLQEENIDLCRTFLACSPDDSLNLTMSLVAKQQHIDHIIALVRDVNRLSIFEQLEINRLICPNKLTGDEIMRFVQGELYKGLRILENGAAELFEVVLPENAPITQSPLREIIMPVGALIGGVKRDDQVFMPHGDNQLRAGDHVVVMVTTRVKKAMQRLLGL